MDAAAHRVRLFATEVLARDTVTVAVELGYFTLRIVVSSFGAARHLSACLLQRLAACVWRRRDWLFDVLDLGSDDWRGLINGAAG
jgi:hypothetical protein